VHFSRLWEADIGTPDRVGTRRSLGVLSISGADGIGVIASGVNDEVQKRFLARRSPQAPIAKPTAQRFSKFRAILKD
jgi:hypothetical protein